MPTVVLAVDQGTSSTRCVVLAAELGWSEARTAAEVTRYRELVAAELAGEAQPDDLGAYQARAGTPDSAVFYPQPSAGPAAP